jgi:hypothetical protein
VSSYPGTVSGEPGGVFPDSGSPSGLSGRQILDSGSLFFNPGRLTGGSGRL